MVIKEGPLIEYRHTAKSTLILIAERSKLLGHCIIPSCCVDAAACCGEGKVTVQ